MAACIKGVAEIADALAPFEGRPFERKPVAVSRRHSRTKAGRRATTDQTGPEGAALAALERQAQDLIGLFRDAVTRLADRIRSAGPPRKVTKTESGASLTPPQLAKRLGVSPEKVRGWIKSGQLVATDVSKSPVGSPRYRISEDNIREFKKRRKAGTPTVSPRIRRKKPDDNVTKYF